ncbi:hypothetical protein BDR03DRAFT_941807 [Suillus americanus]|nr:hypothetical protein BDR03DRAFT_941807 [Suillus americanus]
MAADKKSPCAGKPSHLGSNTHPIWEPIPQHAKRKTRSESHLLYFIKQQMGHLDDMFITFRPFFTLATFYYALFIWPSNSDGTSKPYSLVSPTCKNNM